MFQRSVFFVPMKDHEHSGVWCSLKSFKTKKILTEAAKNCDIVRGRSEFINLCLVLSSRFIESGIQIEFVLSNIDKIIKFCKRLNHE